MRGEKERKEKAPKKKRKKSLAVKQQLIARSRHRYDASSALPRLKPCRPKNYSVNICIFPDICN